MKDSLNRDGTIMCRFQKMEQKRNVNLPLGINASCFGLRRGFFNEVHTQNPSVNAPLSRPHTQADCAQLTSFENTSSPLRVFKDSSHYYKSESYKYYADAFKQKGISLEETGITHLSSQPSLTSKTVAFGSDYLGFAVTDHHLDDSTTTKKSSSSITESTITEEDVMESSFTSAKDGEDVEGIVTTVMINKSDADGDEQDGETGDEVAINEIQEELSSNDNLSSEKSLGKSNIDEAEIVSALTVDKELNSFPTPPNDQLSNEDVASTPKNHQLDLIASTKDCIIEGWNEADEAPVNQVPEQSSTSIGKNSLQANDIIYTLNAASSSHSSHQVAIISKKATSPLAPRERVFFPTDLNQVIVIKTKKFVIPEGLPVQIQAAIKYSFLLEKAIKLIQR